MNHRTNLLVRQTHLAMNRRNRIMKPTRLKAALLAVAAHLHFAINATAATQIDIAGPAGSEQFGSAVAVLPNGNIVVTDPYYDAPGPIADVGAVHLYNSAGVLISTMTGGTAGDRVGSNGIRVLRNGHYVVRSSLWKNGTAAEAGAATWCNGTTGCSGTVSPANSLVGTTAGDHVGRFVSALANGHYVARSIDWDNGTIVNAGVATWCNGTTGCTGPVSSANSLVGSTAEDQIGNDGIQVLPNGNYVLSSSKWDNGGIADAGASTW